MEIIEEIYNRLQNYETGEDYQPLRVEMEVIPPIFLTSQWIHLDGIINYLCVRDALDDLFYVMPTDEVVDTSYLNLPLKKTGDVYHASVGQLNNPRIYKDTIYKRFTDREAYKLSDKARKGRVKINQGHFKDFMINLPLIVTDKITFYCNGDKKELERLLPHLSHVGKKTSIGGGRVRNIQISEENEDYSFFKDGELMRTFPTSFNIPIFEGLTIQRQPYKPPYWDKSNVEMCFTPKPQLKV